MERVPMIVVLISIQIATIFVNIVHLAVRFVKTIILVKIVLTTTLWILHQDYVSAKRILNFSLTTWIAVYRHVHSNVKQLALLDNMEMLLLVNVKIVDINVCSVKIIQIALIATQFILWLKENAVVILDLFYYRMELVWQNRKLILVKINHILGFSMLVVLLIVFFLFSKVKF